MHRLLITLVAWLASLPAAAQAPALWRDPDQGCWYIISPQGAVALRYRRDGTPDCPEAGAQPSATSRITAGPTSAGASARGTTDSAVTGSVPSRTSASTGGSNARQPVKAVARSFACFSADDASSNGPALQSVRIDPQAMLLHVEATSGGARRTERYTIDNNMDAWLGGRNQRDPRLGFVLVQSRGHLRLDWVEGSGRSPIRSYNFRCLAGDAAP